MEDIEVEGNIENHDVLSTRRKRPSDSQMNHINKVKRSSTTSSINNECFDKSCIEVAGRIAGVELENFMCHGHLKIDFDTQSNNCFYIGGPNGSGKSALFAAINIGLGGRGNNNDRGNSVKTYIKEGRSKAKIRLVITNQGLSRHPKYGDFVVVERTITPSSSTYVLKSISVTGKDNSEEVVSKKKADLDRLLVQYGIQLNNPIFWMSQDRSRYFLHQMKPDRLFQVFMCASELEHIKTCYEQCEVIVAGLDAIGDSMKEGCEKMKKEYRAMVERRQRLRTIEDLSKQQDEIGWMLSWCPLRDILEEIQVEEKKREKFRKELERVQKLIDESVKKKNDCLVETSSFQAKINEEFNDLHRLEKIIAEKKSAISNVSSEITSEEAKRERLENTKISYGKRCVRLNEQIAKFKQESQCEKRKEEAALTKINMDKITEKESEVIERLRLVQQERDEMQKAHEQSSSSHDQMIREERKVFEKIRDLEQEINRSEMSTKNAVMRFGENVPKILKILNDNADKFEYLPRGPIGTFVKMRDKNWTFAVEEAIRGLLPSFVFHSKRDHQVFERIMRENHVTGALPSAIFAKFDVHPHDVKSNEPSSDWDTILRVIDVNDTVIRNVLIDLASVEGTVLLKTDDDARRIMDGMCPEKCVRAFTTNGSMAMGRNRNGEGFYRFYACRNTPRALFLLDQTANVDITSMKAGLSRLQNERRKIQDDIKKAASEVVSTQSRHSKAIESYIAVENELKTLRSEYQSLERRFEQLEMEDNYSVVDNMRASLDELNAQIGELNGEIGKLDEDMSQKQKKLCGLHRELEEMESVCEKASDNIALLQNQHEDIQERIRRFDSDSELLRRREERIRESITKVDINIKDLEVKRENASKTANMREENQKSPFIPPDLEQLADTAELNDKYRDLTMKIASLRKVVGNTVTSEELQSFKEKYEERKQMYLELKWLNRRFSEFLMIRKEKFPIMCHSMSMRLKMAFQRLMATRSYHGNLIVDRKNGVININVVTHQKDQSSHPATKSVLQDLRGLSGGERSFTTACFIMALWEIMEAPFRCMDEFDVFMDMVNRRVIMDLLVKLATERYSHHQFIFFTPQGIKELGERENVQVFEMPKVHK